MWRNASGILNILLSVILDKGLIKFIFCVTCYYDICRYLSKIIFFASTNFPACKRYRYVPLVRPALPFDS